MSKRIEYIDVARGIAMICIILGHLGSRSINRVVFTFHVPIFYFITGYFLSDKERLCQFIRKKVKTLLVPYVVTCFMIMISAACIAVLEGQGDQIKNVLLNWAQASVYGAGDSYTSPFVIHQIGAIWFLWATFWGSIILKISQNFKTGNRIVALLSLFFIGIWSRKLFWFPLSIQAGCCAALFMYFGYLLRQVKKTHPLDKISIEIKAVWTLFAAGIWFSFIWNFQSFWLVHCDMGRGIIDVFGCMCACYCLIMISYFLQMILPKFSDGFAYFGRCSILILCIHNVELNTFPWQSLISFLFSHGWPLQESLFWKIVFKLTFDLSLAVLLSRVQIVQSIFSLKSNGTSV